MSTEVSLCHENVISNMIILVAIVPIILVYLLLSKYIIAGVALGGVKE